MSAPGRIMMMLVPICEMFWRMLSFEPWPMAIMMMTAATPMMMPSMERNERNLLLAMARRATLNRLIIFMLELYTISYLTP